MWDTTKRRESESTSREFVHYFLVCCCCFYYNNSNAAFFRYHHGVRVSEKEWGVKENQQKCGRCRFLAWCCVAAVAAEWEFTQNFFFIPPSYNNSHQHTRMASKKNIKAWAWVEIWKFLEFHQNVLREKREKKKREKMSFILDNSR